MSHHSYICTCVQVHMYEQRRAVCEWPGVVSKYAGTAPDLWRPLIGGEDRLDGELRYLTKLWRYIYILQVTWVHIVKTVYKRIFACKLTNNICVIILVRCRGPHWLQPDNIVPVQIRHVIHVGCGVDIKGPHGPSTCTYCRSHSIYDLLWLGGHSLYWLPL